MDRPIWSRSRPQFLIAFVAICDNQAASDKTGQILARVNGDTISIGQLDVLLAHSSTIFDTQIEKLRKKTLDDLINQHLLSQQAIENHLDQDSQVTRATAMAKRQVLAQAYLDHIGEQVSKPSSAEIVAFYKSHPQLFEKRKIYDLQQITIPLTPQNREPIELHLRQPVRLETLSQWLQEKNIPHTSRALAYAAEHLPLERLDEFYRLKKKKRFPLSQETIFS